MRPIALFLFFFHLISALPCRADTFTEALSLTRASEFEKALALYDGLVRGGSNNPELTVAIGLAALHVALDPGQVPKGREALYRVAGQAVVLRMKGDSDKAEEAYRELLEKFPNTPNVHYLYGSHILAGDPAEARRQMKRELQVNPGNVQALGTLAWLFIQRNEFGAALPYAEAAARKAPADAAAHYVLGRALMENGKLQAGIEHLELAEKLDPANLECHLAIATAYASAGRIEEARRERRVALDLAEASISH